MTSRSVDTKHFFSPLIWLGCGLLAVARADDDHSAARPYDLNIIAPVQVAGSDAAAKEFQATVLPGLLSAVRQLLPDAKGESSKKSPATSLGYSPLTLAADSTARVYFLGESVKHQNALGISTTGGGPLSPDAALIFPNLSSSKDDDNDNDNHNQLLRSPGERLVAGDFVDLGTFKTGTTLDFFLIASAASNGKNFYSTDQSLNKDGVIHAVSYAPDGSAYLMVGFEDAKGGGDRDYNDLVFAVRVDSIAAPPITDNHALGAPEPSLATGALLTAWVVFGFRRRQHRCGKSSGDFLPAAEIHREP